MPGDTALILGASKGLGQAIAAECRRREWRTIEVARFRESPAAGTSPHVTTDDRATIVADLVDHGSSAAIVAALRDLHDRRNWPPITRFFWVAGTWWEGEFSEMPTAEVLRLIDVNFRNPMLVAHDVWRRMCVSSRAPLSYCVIGSTSGVRPRKHQEVYVATKHAQVGFARSLGESNRGSKNLHVSLFVLGGMRTHLFDAKPPANYAEFMDPAKVAGHIVHAVAEQRDPYLEQEISRDSALGRSLR